MLSNMIVRVKPYHKILYIKISLMRVLHGRLKSVPRGVWLIPKNGRNPCKTIFNCIKIIKLVLSVLNFINFAIAGCYSSLRIRMLTGPYGHICGL